MLMITMGLFGANGIVVGGYTVGLGVLLIIGVVIAGLVGTARLALGAHDKVQIYAGYLVGFLSQLVALKFYF
jgi:membrane-associated phospholipid phosphatase